MKKYLLLLLFLFSPLLTHAYTSTDIDFLRLYSSAFHPATFTDQHPFTTGEFTGYHLDPNRADYCESPLSIDPASEGVSPSFEYTGGYLLYAPNGNLIGISTTTIYGNTFYSMDGPYTPNLYSANPTILPYNKVYCISESNFITELGVRLPSDPPITGFHQLWDTPDNKCRRNNYTYTRCLEEHPWHGYDYGRYGSNGNKYGYDGRVFYDPFPASGNGAAAILAFPLYHESSVVNVESPEYKVGITNSMIGQWMKKQINLVIGSGFGVFGIILPFVIALIFIAAVVYFIYRGVTFLKH